MISLWSIERITQEYEEAIDKLFVSFADFLISSHFIGFSKSVAGVFKHYDQNAPIAYSFEEAIHLINTDSRLIY